MVYVTETGGWKKTKRTEKQYNTQISIQVTLRREFRPDPARKLSAKLYVLLSTLRKQHFFYLSQQFAGAKIEYSINKNLCTYFKL